LQLLKRIQNPIIVVGGLDSDKYLGVEFNYKFGNLIESSQWIKSSQYFFGCDSGMSHLAGALGIEIKIITCAAYCKRCMTKCYQCYERFSPIEYVKYGI
jgi:hypothetical protein